jgi:hypothetical protein
MATEPRIRKRSLPVIAALVGITVGTFAASSAKCDGADAIIQAFKQAARPTATTAPAFKFPSTTYPDAALTAQLQTTFAQYFSKKINLIPLMRKLVVESAVVEISGVGRILYNPSYLLLLLLPDATQGAGKIQIATLTDVERVLDKDPLPNSLSAYTQGFQDFRQFSDLMRNPNAGQKVQSAWSAAPRSDEDRARVRELLVGPVRQATTIRNEPERCRQTINEFVNSVRSGKRSTVPLLPGLTTILRPINFVRAGDKFFLVLGEALIARYYVVAEFDAGSRSCPVTWERPLFAL